MERLFSSLSHAVEGEPALAIMAAFAWGVASLLLSPCHLASIPLVVGFVNGQQCPSARRGFAVAALFSLGLGVAFAVAGTSALYGMLLIAVYGLGHCSIILAAGGSTGWVTRYLRWTNRSRVSRYLRYTSGLLVLAGGVYLLYVA